MPSQGSTDDPADEQMTMIATFTRPLRQTEHRTPRAPLVTDQAER